MSIEMIRACDDYLSERTGTYEFRSIRYKKALFALMDCGLSNHSTVMDIGAGWTEFDYCLRTEGGLRCRYIPIDGGIDGTNLELWVPRRAVDYFVCLELLEHLVKPQRLVDHMKVMTTGGGAIVVSTPNPLTVDVLAMDKTHKTPIYPAMLEAWGFKVEVTSLFGKPDDSLFGVWHE